MCRFLACTRQAVLYMRIPISWLQTLYLSDDLKFEQNLSSSLYGRNKVHFTPGDHTCTKNLESVFVKALDTFGEVT